MYRELVQRVNDTVLLHSQFTRRDRNEIENSIKRRLPKILVSTQVVEVSLDLDFEQGFTKPAPIDAIVQRLGRINRYARRSPTLVRVFSRQAHSYNIYDSDLTSRSLRVLSALPRPLGEDDLNDAADHVYGRGYSAENQDKYNDGLNYRELKYSKKYLVAGTNQDWIDEVIDEKEGSIDLLPGPLVDEYNTGKDAKQETKQDGHVLP